MSKQCVPLSVLAVFYERGRSLCSDGRVVWVGSAAASRQMGACASECCEDIACCDEITAACCVRVAEPPRERDCTVDCFGWLLTVRRAS